MSGSHPASRDMDMLHGPVARKMLVFALPVALTGLFQQLFTAADIFVLGRFVGKEAMAAAGNPAQWGTSFPPEELLKEDIDSNRLFVYLVNGELEAVFAFILGPDPTYAVIEDGQWLNDTLPYGTIHRLASAGKRKGVATDVITWCLEHCESLRADTHADNKAMQHILEETGFTRCGVIHVADGSPRFAYQRMSLTMPLEH